MSGSQAAHLLGAKLWKAAKKATQELNGEPTSDGEEDALVDCLLVPGGGDPIYAHLAVLAARSPMLEELIMLEKRDCLLYTSPSPRDGLLSRMPSSA